MESKKPRFTVAIPVLNGSASIDKAVRSALNQSYADRYEVLVVDNCSDDDTYGKLIGYGDEVRVARNSTTVSMYENHNVCLEKASGDYIVFCHADDSLTEHCLDHLDRELRGMEFPVKSVVWGRSHFRDYLDIYSLGGGALNAKLRGPECVKAFLYYGLTPSGTCYSRESFLSLGGFVKSNHRLAPSDMTTMILLALNHFEFKMLDHFLFERRLATTAKESIERKEYMESKVDAFFELEKIVGMDGIRLLVETAASLSEPPISFYYACVKNSFLTTRVRSSLLRFCLKRPALFARRDVLKVLLGV